ncbi:hypothetical protein IMG5_206930 [Ichthyophthirius multifiliis]|uniref:N-terminal Ras-GEF domain-containing protein n=1 Tax=Ichthyophthirius multifiliis TaxID=5932 RepID=G0R5Q6_ICHMU|nr:hypothetical protein IMG5_206930 [Ichthyophthirius multifiliis]EGR27202.1 hypothetical protein IMG5_206930 [Ichthyophthirius multifiliis]|eukprot:XP_004024086.1 hypothetical protein IMG5_206930 [Ichthyophthirius multifiliis]
MNFYQQNIITSFLEFKKMTQENKKEVIVVNKKNTFSEHNLNPKSSKNLKQFFRHSTLQKYFDATPFDKEQLDKITQIIQKDADLIEQIIINQIQEIIQSSTNIHIFIDLLLKDYQKKENYTPFFKSEQIQQHQSENFYIEGQKTPQGNNNTGFMNFQISDNIQKKTQEKAIEKITQQIQQVDISLSLSSLIFCNRSKKFRNNFILTSDYFITPYSLVLYFIHFYYIPVPYGYTESEKEQYRKREQEIKTNIWLFFKDFVELRCNYLYYDNILISLLLKFFRNILHDDYKFIPLYKKVKEIHTKYEFNKIKTKEKKSPLNQINKQNLEIIIFEPKPLILYDSEQIVKVACYIYKKWLQKLNISDLLNSKINQRLQNKQLTKYSQKFNYTVYWLINLVLSQKDIQIRINYLKKYFDLIKLAHEYKCFPFLHIMHTSIYQIQIFLKKTWDYFLQRIKQQKMNGIFDWEIEFFENMFNDKYEGYYLEINKLIQQKSLDFVPCINPYLQEINVYENKFKQQKKEGEIIVPWIMHERIGEKLNQLLVCQKNCQDKNFEEIYQNYKNSNSEEVQICFIFKKLCFQNINDILLQNQIKLQDIEIFFINKSNEIENDISLPLCSGFQYNNC